MALYLGMGNGSSHNYIQGCHGGIEIGYNPHSSYLRIVGQRIDVLAQKNGFMLLDPVGLHPLTGYFKNDRRIDSFNGFMWTDFFMKFS